MTVVPPAGVYERAVACNVTDPVNVAMALVGRVCVVLKCDYWRPV